MTPKATPQPPYLHGIFEKIREGITTYGVDPYFCVLHRALETRDDPNAINEVVATVDWFLDAHGELGSDRMREILNALDNLAPPAPPPPKAPALDVHLMCKLAQSVSTLKLPKRVLADLQGRHGDAPITYIYQLVQLKIFELLGRKRIDTPDVKQVKNLLASMGLGLEMQLDPAMLRAVREEIANQSGRGTHALP